MDKKLSIFDMNGNVKGIYGQVGEKGIIAGKSNETDSSRFGGSPSSSDTDSYTEESDLFITKEMYEKNYREQLALDALNDWKKITDIALVPEHVETRSLYNFNTGTELEQVSLKIKYFLDLVNCTYR